jgi:SEC-C motif-containing protein
MIDNEEKTTHYPAAAAKEVKQISLHLEGGEILTIDEVAQALFPAQSSERQLRQINWSNSIFNPIYKLKIDGKSTMHCYCCSGRKFEDCCEPFINESALPQTAEELMRSRYSAYATASIEYLLRTTHPSTRKFHDSKAIEEWAKTNRWEKLEIVLTGKGTRTDRTGTVEFKAHYTDAENRPQIHHEQSNFRKELGKWFFVDGKVL